MPVLRRLATLLALLCLFSSVPARAQSILRDAETEKFLKDISDPIAEAAGLSPANFQVVLINDSSINAFVAGGQIVFIHSGLIDKADNANEVQGVIAHEIGHIAGGHVPLGDRGVKPAIGISLLSIVLGVAAIAAGAGDAGAGILAAGQRAALGKYLAFTRTQEATADAAAVRFLDKAGISGKGLLTFFKKLQDLEFRLAVPQDNSFDQTHPLSGERIQALTANVEESPFYNKGTDPALEVRFKRIQAKLRGYVNEPTDTLRRYPPSDQSVYANYARAYAYHLSGFPEQAKAACDALLKVDPNDPYFLELDGQILLESGKPVDALVPLRRATDMTRNPLIATTFGHALIATDDKSHYPEAEKVLRDAVSRDDDNPFAWYQLGTLYETEGDYARSALATAERANLTGDDGLALLSAQRAMAGLPQGSRDWIRAQDILLVSQNSLADKKKRR